MSNEKSNFNMNFNIMIIGQIVSLFGSSILRFSLSLFILDLTGSAKIFGIILAISTIPTAVLSPLGGALADRVSRKNLMVYFDLANCLIVGFMAAFIYKGDQVTVLIGIVMTLLSVISTCYQPTVQASIPSLVNQEQLMKANGIVSGVSAITNFAGPVLAGLLYGIINIQIITVISCISFFLSAILMKLFMHIPFEKIPYKQGALKTILLDIKEGVVYIIKRNPFLVRIMLIAASMNLFITPLFLVGIPYIIKIILGMDDSFFGFTQGGISLSMISAGVIIGFIAKKLKIKNLYLWFVVCGVMFVPMALSINTSTLNSNHGNTVQYVIFSLSAMFIMFCITIVNIFVMTIIQQQTPNEFLGKIMSILVAVSTCAVPIGQVIFGVLIDFLASNTYILVLVLGAITSLVAFATQRILRQQN